MRTAMASAVTVVEARAAPPAGVDDETLVMLLGVLNLAALFLYSAYQFVQDRPRLRSTYDRYVDGQVRRVLDDLVMRVHQSAYFSSLLDTVARGVDSDARGAGAGAGPLLARLDFDRVRVLAARFPFPAAPGRQLAWLRRLQVTDAERTALAAALPLVAALSRLPAPLRQGLQRLAQPQQPLAAAEGRAYNGLLQLADGLSWRDVAVALLKPHAAGPQLRHFTSKWNKKKHLHGPKMEALVWKKAGKEAEISPLEVAESAESAELWTGSHWTDRWFQLASLVAPVLLDAGKGYAVSRRRPDCLPAVVCQLNSDWKPHGAVRASLSPLARLVLRFRLSSLPSRASQPRLTPQMGT